MSGRSDQFDVRLIPAGGPDHRLALHVALELPPPRRGVVEPQIADLIAKARSGLASIDLLFGAYRGERLVSACLAVESPGAAAMVFAPHDQETEIRSLATMEALRVLQEAAWRRSIRLLEVLLEPGSAELGRVLEGAGFRYLTTLLYLTRRGHRIEPLSRPACDLTWVSYSPDHEALFCEALDGTYVQSLDCPELTGLRTATEVLAGHRARVDFDPALWWVALRRGAPVGIVLLNPIESQTGLEIEYIGVAQPSRGTGVADALLERTAEMMRQQNAKYVTLAVDRRNTPARKMYARWDYVETLRRDALIASPPHA